MCTNFSTRMADSGELPLTRLLRQLSVDASKGVISLEVKKQIKSSLRLSASKSDQRDAPASKEAVIVSKVDTEVVGMLPTMRSSPNRKRNSQCILDAARPSRSSQSRC